MESAHLKTHNRSHEPRQDRSMRMHHPQPGHGTAPEGAKKKTDEDRRNEARQSLIDAQDPEHRKKLVDEEIRNPSLRRTRLGYLAEAVRDVRMTNRGNEDLVNQFLEEVNDPEITVDEIAHTAGGLTGRSLGIIIGCRLIGEDIRGRIETLPPERAIPNAGIITTQDAIRTAEAIRRERNVSESHLRNYSYILSWERLQREAQRQPSVAHSIVSFIETNGNELSAGSPALQSLVDFAVLSSKYGDVTNPTIQRALNEVVNWSQVSALLEEGALDIVKEKLGGNQPEPPSQTEASPLPLTEEEKAAQRILLTRFAPIVPFHVDTHVAMVTDPDGNQEPHTFLVDPDAPQAVSEYVRLAYPNETAIQNAATTSAWRQEQLSEDNNYPVYVRDLLDASGQRIGMHLQHIMNITGGTIYHDVYYQTSSDIPLNIPWHEINQNPRGEVFTWINAEEVITRSFIQDFESEQFHDVAPGYNARGQLIAVDENIHTGNYAPNTFSEEGAEPISMRQFRVYYTNGPLTSIQDTDYDGDNRPVLMRLINFNPDGTVRGGTEFIDFEERNDNMLNPVGGTALNPEDIANIYHEAGIKPQTPEPSAVAGSDTLAASPPAVAASPLSPGPGSTPQVTIEPSASSPAENDARTNLLNEIMQGIKNVPTYEQDWIAMGVRRAEALGMTEEDFRQAIDDRKASNEQPPATPQPQATSEIESGSAQKGNSFGDIMAQLDTVDDTPPAPDATTSTQQPGAAFPPPPTSSNERSPSGIPSDFDGVMEALNELDRQE